MPLAGISRDLAQQLRLWEDRRGGAGGDKTDKELVRSLARALADQHPGRSVELRIPPVTAVQLIAGPTHRRGTPRAVVEMSPGVFLELCAGIRAWPDAVESGDVDASGERSDLSQLFAGADQ